MRSRGRQIRMVQGDTVQYDISVLYGSDHVEYELMEGDILRFRMKKYLYDKEPIIEKQISAMDPILDISPEDTISCMPGEYHYNIDLLTTEGDIYTIVPDSLFIIIPKV